MRLLLLLAAIACARPAAAVIANTAPADTCDAIAPALARAAPPLTGRSNTIAVAYRVSLDRACRRSGWSARTIACVVDSGVEACRRALPAPDRDLLDDAQIEAQRAVARLL